ncbi:restriction endonuclease subunit S [Chryseobacterium arthrosphaerae]|uniref:restriction endonuclease subunit S n=1 Tax=Chryseobacterium arthrosphaerae TaxID=651561 RepID=UPI000F5008A1|nr:restriction endonuclease subunit S [Chryseobacterium arthrosphaerae]AYZ13725.1 restriction endonuclease subunit S [Chryseobacterium arthrosphaerae]
MPLDGYIPVLRSNNIKNSLIDLQDLVYVKKSKITKKQLLIKGDLLITASTGSIKVIGKNAYVENDMEASFGAFCKVVRPKKIDSSYLKHMFQSQQYFSYIQNVVNGANINNIKNEHLDNFKIPLPPLETQKHIAQILDDAAALRDKTKQLIKEYDALAQSIFLDMFGDPVRNTKKIKQITIDEITNVSSGSTPSRENESYYNGNIPWVKTGEVNGRVILNTEENLSEEGLKNSSCKVYPKGSLIIAMYGQGKTRGQVGILGVPASTNQACAVLSPSEKMNFTFLYQHLKLCYEDLRRLGRGGNQPNLNAGLIKSYSVLFPPIDLQNQFAEKIALIEQQKEFAKQELKESEDLFNCLLQKAFKGELV